MKKIVFTVVTLFLLIGIMGFVFAEENSSSPATNTSSPSDNQNSSSPADNQNTSSPSNDGSNTSSPSHCGKLIYFCSDNSPYCGLVKPQIDQFEQDSGCVEVTRHIIPNFMDLVTDNLAIKYGGINFVPAFVYVDENGCFAEIGKGGGTKLEDIRNGIDNFECGRNSSSPSNPSTPSNPSCPYYKCDGGYAPKCEIVNNQCSCESCPAIPIEPNSTTGPIEIPETQNPQTISYECSGCSLDKKCYPFGFRKDKNYCDDITSTFTSQKVPSTSCENSFECDSNLCINNQCVSGSLWDKIMRWFSKLFGGR